MNAPLPRAPATALPSAARLHDSRDGRRRSAFASLGFALLAIAVSACGSRPAEGDGDPDSAGGADTGNGDPAADSSPESGPDARPDSDAGEELRSDPGPIDQGPDRDVPPQPDVTAPDVAPVDQGPDATTAPCSALGEAACEARPDCAVAWQGVCDCDCPGGARGCAGCPVECFPFSECQPLTGSCPDPDSAWVSYISRDPEHCATIDFDCFLEGWRGFDGPCGCGCMAEPPNGGECREEIFTTSGMAQPFSLGAACEFLVVCTSGRVSAELEARLRSVIPDLRCHEGIDYTCPDSAADSCIGYVESVSIDEADAACAASLENEVIRMVCAGDL